MKKHLDKVSRLLLLAKERVMWKVQYKPDNATQTWVILNSFDNMPSALVTACRVASECCMVVVVDPEGSVVWSN